MEPIDAIFATVFAFWLGFCTQSLLGSMRCRWKAKVLAFDPYEPKTRVQMSLARWPWPYGKWRWYQHLGGVCGRWYDTDTGAEIDSGAWFAMTDAVRAAEWKVEAYAKEQERAAKRND